MRRFRHRLELALEAVSDGVAIVTADGGIELVNAAGQRILGAMPEELHDARWPVFDEHAVPLAPERHPIALAAASGEPQHAILGVEMLDGDLHWLQVDARVIEERDDGAPRRVLCTFRDITERRAQEAALAESEERYRTVVDQLGEGVVLQDAELQIVTYNDAALSILGVTADEMRAAHWRVFRADGSPCPRAEWPAARALRTGEPQLRRVIGVERPDGALAWLTASAQPLCRPREAGPYAVVTSFVDITSERERQDELARERAALADAQAIAHVGSWVWDPSVDSTEWSTEMYRIFDRDPGAGPATGEERFARVHPDDRDRVVAGFEQAFGGGARFELDYRIITRSGETRYLHGIGHRDGAGRHVGTVQDITERKRTEESLREARELLALSFDESPLGMTLTTIDGRALRVNRAFAEMVGGCVEALAGDPMGCTHPDDRPAVEACLDALCTGVTDRDAWETRYVHADGRIVWARVSASLLRDGAGAPRYVVSQITDITEHKQREAEEQALRHIAEHVAAGTGPEALFAAAAERLGALFDSATAAVVRFDRAAHAGIVEGAWARDGERFTGAALRLDGVSGAAIVFRTGRASRMERPPTPSADPACKLMEQLNISGAIAAPIVVAGELWGSVGVAFRDTPPPVGGELRLERFAHLLALAISNAHAWQELARQAVTDAVTGLANARAYHERLRAELGRARRRGRVVGLVLMDIDHFKRVNDVYGHQEGDRVLAQVGRLLAAQAREGELVARVGGEEFAWILPETDEAGAYCAAERVRAAIEREDLVGFGSLTVSAGVSCSAPGDDAEQLVRRADRALYRAKDRGRNMTCRDGESAILAPG